jgi:hypothetical protein
LPAGEGTGAPPQPEPYAPMAGMVIRDSNVPPLHVTTSRWEQESEALRAHLRGSARGLTVSSPN